MNLYQNEEVAWLHVQDLQREAENRRLMASERPSATRAIVRRLFGRTASAPAAGQAGQRKKELA